MSTVYVDRGMAWCTVVGGFVANFLLGGLAKSYGLVMEAFQEEFQSGSAYLLLAGGLIYTLMYCLSLVNHYISLRYGSRPVVLAGAIGSCISLLVAAYSPNIALWVIAIGFGVGASLSCIYFTVFSVVGQCFRRYLGLANGISVAGVSVGQMAFPSLITYLNHTYGTRGGTVVMSAICLHLLITAALMPRHIVDPDAPPKPMNESSPKKQKSKRQNCRRFRKRNAKVVDDMDNPETTVKLTANSTLVSDVLDNSQEKESMCWTVDEKALANAMGDAPVCKSTLERINANGDLHGSVVSVDTAHAKRLSSALLVVYILAKIFGDIGDVSVSFIAPAHGTKLGLGPVTISRAIAVGGAVDLVTRLGVGWLTDRPGCMGRRGVLLSVTWLIEGLNALAFTELSRFKPPKGQNEDTTPIGLLIGYFICFGIHGVCSGTAMTQMVVVLCDWVGSARLAHSLALTMVVLGVLISPGQFAIGYLADVTDSYVWPMRLCFFILIIAGCLLLLEFPVRWFYARSARHGQQLIVNGGELLNHKSSPEQGCHYPHAGDCWQVVDSDSDDDGDSRQHNSTDAHLIQTGISPVPAHLALVDGGRSDGTRSSAMFVCAQQRSDEWSDLEGV